METFHAAWPQFQEKGVIRLAMFRFTLGLSLLLMMGAARDSGNAMHAQEIPAKQLPPLSISEFTPQPAASLSHTRLERAKFPVVDAHTHFGLRLRHDAQQLKGFVELMDRNQIAICVSLDGMLGPRLDEHLRFLWTDFRDRFVIFAHIDWQGRAAKDRPADWDCNQSDFARRMAIELRLAAEKGISGLKVFKSLGLEYRNPDGSFIAVDDPRFDPIWQTCGELGLPVLIHTGDPSAFFQPITPENERYEELSRHPEWHFPADRFPSRSDLHAARENLFRRHRETRFIAAHFGNDAEDLSDAARILETYPNVVLDIASRISELGRQPYSARDFFLRFSDRILFATDGPWPEERYQSYWRFAETRDEYFPYSEKPIPPQGLWRIYGIHLPDEVLRKIYFENAARLIPGVAQRLDSWKQPQASSNEYP
jgi:predicted TIM-barrel fold metal-dependent hydrolase